MKKFFIIMLCGAMLICSNVFGQIDTKTGTYKLQTGDFRIGTFCAPDESNLSMVLTTQQVFGGAAVDPEVEFYLHITSVVGDTVRGSVRYLVPKPGVLYGLAAGTYHYVGPGITSIGFTAIKCGWNYRFKFEGTFQPFDEWQVYDFAAFNGMYRPDVLTPYMDANRNTWNVVNFTKVSAGTASKTASSRIMSFSIEFAPKKNVIASN